MIRCMIIDSDHASRRTLSRELAKDDTFSVTGMYDYALAVLISNGWHIVS